MEPKWSQQLVFCATLSQTKILKDLPYGITTFLVRGPPKTDSETKPKTALENNAPKKHPTCESCSIFGPPHWAPEEGTNLSRRHPNCELGVLWGPKGSQMATKTLQKPTLAPISNIFDRFVMLWGCNLSHYGTQLSARDSQSCKDTGSV